MAKTIHLGFIWLFYCPVCDAPLKPHTSWLAHAEFHCQCGGQSTLYRVQLPQDQPITIT